MVNSDREGVEMNSHHLEQLKADDYKRGAQDPHFRRQYVSAAFLHACTLRDSGDMDGWDSVCADIKRFQKETDLVAAEEQHANVV